ncbi:MAG TPA: ribonuclease T2 [Tabrizicola sp.]|nr:ribonuclease T2 [Tabrizicola sp.]
MRLLLLAIAAFCWAANAKADGERGGDFDYYVLSLSWSSAWCLLEGDARDDPQCNAGRGLAFVLHGLWPQYEEGWPAFCRTSERDPSRGETASMSDIMGGAGLAFYQWKKHGRCSGLSPLDYFRTARRAYERVRVPEVLTRMRESLEVPASVIEDAFLESNPGLLPDQITITCKEGLIQEVRICLSKDLKYRRCGPDVNRDCRLEDAVLEAIR